MFFGKRLRRRCYVQHCTRVSIESFTKVLLVKLRKKTQMICFRSGVLSTYQRPIERIVRHGNAGVGVLLVAGVGGRSRGR